MTPDPDALDLTELLTGDLELHGRIMPASNATFLGEVAGRKVVYKPVAGERPLWDFPDGTLAGREVAAYLLSETLGWDVVPPTYLRDGPHGVGMVQLWQDVDPEQDAVDIVATGEVPEGWLHVFDGVDADDRDVSLVHEDTVPLRRMAVFDVLANNADRKGGHVLAMPGGHRYGVDHGLTFHIETKLRTVLWGWLGEGLDEEEVAGLRRVREALGGALDGELALALVDHVTEDEITVLARRCDRLLRTPVMPSPRGHGPAIPWPPF
ncbi:SCO1664 family protein [Nocardioides lentus]|uniref:SCO1664 family protein n=1 Tax=Nocardioides lentus TaxID=338077 RepID=A0ABN2P1G0_9ACTN